jgi:hypothetical protein
MQPWILRQQIGFLAHWVRTYATLDTKRFDERERTLISGTRSRLRRQLEALLMQHG